MNRRGFIVPIGGAEEKIRDRKILRRFVEICGSGRARLAVIPTASQLEDSGPSYVELFQELGIGEAISLPFESRSDCDRKDWLDILEGVDGVFLTGGNQLRLSTTLGGTPVSEILRERNQQGLHIGGTSAGAAYVSEHMIACGDEGPTPRPSLVTLAPGLGLTRKIIVDQHFRQRDRLGRLLTALSYNPFPVGIGLDEDTAAFLDADEVLEVRGSGGITVVDLKDAESTSMDSARRHDPVSVVGARLHILVHGQSFDLKSRRVLATQGDREAIR